MPLWSVLVLGLAGALGFSALVGLAVGAILGQVSREVTDLFESDPWQLEPTVAWSATDPAASIGGPARLSLPAA